MPELCDAIGICDAIANAIAWDKLGALLAALAFAYGLAMSVAFVLYLYRFRGQRTTRRPQTRA